MIVYDPALLPSYREFGLAIPLENSRWERTFSELQGLSTLGDWHYSKEWSAVRREDLPLAHSENYIKQLFSDPQAVVMAAYEGERYLTLPSRRPLGELVERAIVHVAGTLTTCSLALDLKWAYFMGGGMHHALSFAGQGFCLLNDIVIALRMLQRSERIKRALVIDVDVHKGDGTAEITQGDDSITTVSFHGSETWPLVGGDYAESFLPSDCDRPLENGRQYLQVLEETLAQLPCHFDLCLVVQGADPFELDELPSSQQIALTLQEMLQRDQLIHLWLQEHSIPQAYCMGGGYGKSTWQVYFQYLSWALQL